MTANSGTIPAITAEGDLIVSDELNHASIIDGVRLSKARAHGVPALATSTGSKKVLAKARANGGKNGPYRNILVITDGVFSMDGDIAPLAGICDVADRYEAAVMVDDAHASGVLGRNGRGTVDHFDLHGRVDIQVGTLSKAIGVMGGYIAGRQHLKDYLTQRCRTLLFSTSQPPAVAAACIAAIDVLEQEPERIERLWDNTRFFKTGLARPRLRHGHLRDADHARHGRRRGQGAAARRRLFERGIFATSVVFPTVALGKARVRTIVTSEHSREDLQTCIDAFASVGRDLRLI